MWKSIAWACSLLGIACGNPPTVAIIQTAYEREEAAGSTLHSRDLKVLQAKCHDNSGGRFLCEVTFTVASNSQDPNQRLYFDVIAVARTPDGWVLESGLCRR
jgi:hypothetical protein